MKKMLIYLASNWLQLVGGLWIGADFCMNSYFKGIICFSIGILCIGVSYYYKFIYKES